MTMKVNWIAFRSKKQNTCTFLTPFYIKCKSIRRKKHSSNEQNDLKFMMCLQLKIIKAAILDIFVTQKSIIVRLLESC